MRRSRPTALSATAVALALMVGCSADGGAGPSPTGTSSSAPSTAEPNSPPGSPSASGSPSPGASDVIPSSALLRPEDLGGAKLEPLPAGDNAHLRPARPCGTPYPGDATRVAAVAMRAYVSPAANETPRVVLQYVGLHPGHADSAFAEIVAAVRRCPGSLDPGKHRWEAAGTGPAGDESLLLRVSARFDYGGDEAVTTTPAVVARVGDHVTVVADLGWENASGDESFVRNLTAKAVERLRSAA
ncbi:hypothetical protein O7626_12005 [Micromonospora sp. WMMD1102]|uniref:hypothetical protein n=1 Tax=Micromonospora sp. WMMD1102 TaxID=3016105 RepID=UPI002414D9C8|nr:hypothetical protein [Micromonospora sp. WMMD1102]MDG4786646.1 hypothetical protein [Micromonospora sp. WMMD1102]